MSHRLPVIAVVGRPNVGKSTFFNRVIGKRVAIVDDQPGVTRDRNFAKTDWAGHDFFIVDTGGVIEGSEDALDVAIRGQAMAAVEEADIILFLVDGRDGVQPLDERLAEVLRKANKPVVLVVNKMDNLPQDQAHLDFWSLGIGEPVPVSALSGKGSGDLLDRVLAELPDWPDSDSGEDDIRVAVVGKPNVGKSSMVNRLIGEDRVVVSDIAGTTRDPIDTRFQYHGKTLVFVDTAGLRRQAKVKDSLEYYSALRTDRVVHGADVCIVLVDASEEDLHAQDVRILQTAWDAGKAVILLANKWDLVEKDTMTAPEWEKKVRARIPFLQWVPIVFTSALTGQRIRKCLDLVLEVNETRSKRVETHEVNEVLEALARRQPPPHFRGKRVKVKYATQVSVRPPTFAIFSNFPRELPEHYIRFLHNGFRDAWSFMGSPIRLNLRGGREE
ncbi:MAG: ribosome biogenesis GTPase Der [Gemmatimonadetes bacterium]|nr:ribosome biogenesis GTPase Der [Gemmatimonadota bacterium]MDA1104373.1 ribosome biogenesis GTPase Der [Gemmatimonadota bacterium]